jgi:hypothetical protein
MDVDTYIVTRRSLDGTLHVVETDAQLTFEQASEYIFKGEWDRVVSVQAYNPVEGWSQDRTEDAALEVARWARDEGYLPRPALEFVDAVDQELANEVRWLEV